jgi:hypothetical protein
MPDIGVHSNLQISPLGERPGWPSLFPPSLPPSGPQFPPAPGTARGRNSAARPHPAWKPQRAGRASARPAQQFKTCARASLWQPRQLPGNQGALVNAGSSVAHPAKPRQGIRGVMGKWKCKGLRPGHSSRGLRDPHPQPQIPPPAPGGPASAVTRS